MARLSQEKIEEIRHSVDIADVIGEYIPLTKAGRNYKGVCPFHPDTHPSLSISEEKQIFMCFVCGTGGNVFTFLQKHLNISYMEAVKEVAERGNIDLGDFVVEKKIPVHTSNQPLYDMHKKAFDIYSYYLNTKAGLNAKNYLLNRGFTSEIINTFGIGYAPDSNVLYESFKKLDYNDVDIVNSGLVIESNDHFDRFRNRIMFPLHNQHGEVVGFSGRIYEKDQEGAKYLNSPESEIFIKGDNLYHYHLCREAVKKAGFVYILEGFMDVIALHKAGIQNTVAVMGTALTSSHLTALKRLTNTVHLCLDGDNAGVTAMNKYCDYLTENGFNVKIIVLPDNHDPDEIYEIHGKEGLIAALNKTQGPIEFKMDYEYQRINADNYDDRKQYLDKICQSISTLKDELDKDYYVRLLSNKTGFSYELIKSRIRGVTVKEEIYHTVKKSSELMDKYNKAERDLLFYMLRDYDISRLYEKKVGFMYDDDYRIIASHIIDYYRTHKQLEIADFINTIKKDEIIQKVLLIYNEELPIPCDEVAINDYVNTIAANAKELKKQQLLEQFNYVLDPIQKSEILTEIINLSNTKGEN